MNRNEIKQALEGALENKGKRKFTQSVEAVINFRGLDVSKPENRVNLDVVLPKGRGKEVPVIVFAEGQVALESKNAGASKIFSKDDIEDLKKNRKELKKLADTHEFLAAPQMMIEVGKNLGQVLGGRAKLPKPIIGSVPNAINQAKDKVRIATRGKYLPTVQCAIGTETMDEASLVENFEAVYEKVKDKVGESSIGACYVKLTMGKAVKIGAVAQVKQ